MFENVVKVNGFLLKGFIEQGYDDEDLPDMTFRTRNKNFLNAGYENSGERVFALKDLKRLKSELDKVIDQMEAQLTLAMLEENQ